MSKPQQFQAKRWLMHLLITSTLCITGCSGVLESDEPPRSSWWLAPTQLPAVEAAPKPVTLMLHSSVVPGLDTDRILNLNPQYRLNHYAGAHWAGRLPELWDSLLQRSFAMQGRFRAIENRIPRAGDCQLGTELQAFFGRLDEAGETRTVEIAVLADYSCGDVSWSANLSSEQPVSRNAMSAIVAAQQSALDDVLRQIDRRMDQADNGT